MVDWFKKALLPAAGAAAAIPLLQDEGEAASIPWKTAENFLENKLGAQYKTVPQELKDNLRKIVSRDIPEEYGLKTPASDAADLQFIKKTLVDDNRFKFDPTVMNNIRLGQTAIPEEIMSRANLDIKFLDPKSHSAGNIRPLGNSGFQVGYNPLHPILDGSGLGTAGHELGGHLPQLLKMKAGSFSPELDDKISFINNAGLLNKAELKNLPYSPADKDSSIYKKATPEQRELIDRAWQLYEDNSMERVARDMGDIFVKKGRQSDLASLKDYENFKKIYGEVSGNAYTRYNEENPELAAELIDRIKERGMFSSNLSKAALATPFAVAGTQLAGEGEGEAGPVNIENIFRGGKKTVRDSLGRLTYPIQDRAAYRTIDNPAGAGYFGDVFNVKLNMKNIFDPRYDTEAVFPIAKEVANRGIMSERDTVRNLVTGNWDALELGEDNYGGKVGSVQKVLQDLGYSGNHQLEPTSFIKGKWNIGDIVNRRYQDVYQTFDKNELQMGDNVTDRYAIDNTLSKRYVDDPLEANLPDGYKRYANEIEAPFSYSRDALVKPVTLYNGEPLKQFDPMFKDVLEEFRPDAHYLYDNYENKGLFPPSQQPFSLQTMREKHGLTDMTDSWAVESSKKSNTKIEEDWVLNHLGGKLSFDVSEPDLKTLMKNTSGALSEAYFDNDIEGTKILVNDIKQIADQIKATGNDKIFKQFKDAFGQNQYDEYFSQPANVNQNDEPFPSLDSMGIKQDSPSNFGDYSVDDLINELSAKDIQFNDFDFNSLTAGDLKDIGVKDYDEVTNLFHSYPYTKSMLEQSYSTYENMGAVSQMLKHKKQLDELNSQYGKLTEKMGQGTKLPPPNLDLDLDTPVNQNPFQYNNTNQPSIKYQAYADALLDPTTADEATLKQAKKFQDKNPDFSPKSVHKFKLENDIDFKKYTEDFDPEDVYYPSFNLKNVVDKSSKYWKPFLEDIAKESGFKPQTYALGNAAFKGEFPDWYKPTTQDIEYIESLNPGVKAGLSMDYQANVTNLKQAAKSWKVKQGAESESVNNVLKDLGLVGLGAASSTLLYPDQSEAGLKEKLSANPTELGKNLEKSIIDYLEGRGEKVSAPSEWYRGIPKGSTPESVGGDKYVHATPWADVAARGGKFDSPGGNDVYTYDNLPEGKYFRGGSLAGDPLEATRVGDIQGTSWEDALDKAKGLYDKRVGKSLDEVLGYGVKGKELEQYADSISQEVAGDVAREFKFGTFETDAFGKPGVWEGAEKIPGTFKTRRPLLRSQDDLFRAVERYEKEGVSKDNIAEIKILKNLGKYLPETSVEDGVITPHGNAIASAIASLPSMAWDLAKQYGGTVKKVFTGEPIDSEDTRNIVDLATLPLNAVKGNAALAGLNVLWPDNKEFDEKKMVKEGIVYPANFIPRKDARGKVLIDTSTLNFDPLGQAMNNFNQYENEARTFFE